MSLHNRFANAIFAQAGAVNGAAVSTALQNAYKEAREETRDTSRTNKDPAVQMILHQLCWLAGIDAGESDDFNFEHAYRECLDRCQSYKMLAMVGELDRVKLFVCDYH